jgi:hypothetical protein
MLLEAPDFLVEDVARGDGASRAVDAQKQRANPLVAARSIELLSQPCEHALLGEAQDRSVFGRFSDHALDLHEQDLGARVAVHHLLDQRIGNRARKIDRDAAAEQQHRSQGTRGGPGDSSAAEARGTSGSWGKRSAEPPICRRETPRSTRTPLTPENHARRHTPRSIQLQPLVLPQFGHL